MSNIGLSFCFCIYSKNKEWETQRGLNYWTKQYTVHIQNEKMLLICSQTHFKNEFRSLFCLSFLWLLQTWNRIHKPNIYFMILYSGMCPPGSFYICNKINSSKRNTIKSSKQWLFSEDLVKWAPLISTGLSPFGEGEHCIQVTRRSRLSSFWFFMLEAGKCQARNNQDNSYYSTK